MSNEERRQNLTLATQDCLDTWHDWVDNREITEIDENFENAVIRCCEQWRKGDIPGDMRDLQERVADLHKQWNVLAKTLDSAPAGSRVYPRQEFWAALEALEAEFNKVVSPPKEYPTPEFQLPRDASLPGITEAQLCRMYGFTSDGTRNGIPRLGELHKALEDPKGYFKSNPGWLWPEQRAHALEEQQRQEEAELLRQRRHLKLQMVPTGAKESIEELLELPGISGKQICKMKLVDGRQMTRDELYAYFQEHGITKIPPWDAIGVGVGVSDDETPLQPLKPLQASEGPKLSVTDDPTLSWEDILEAAGPLTQEQQIIHIHQADPALTATEIAEIVTKPDAPVSAPKVGKVLKRFEEDPAAFETAQVGG